jgi:GNAT superfamily N-acetyltransferase
MKVRKAENSDKEIMGEFLRGLDEYNLKELDLGLLFKVYNLDVNNKDSYVSIIGNYMEDEDNVFYIVEDENKPMGFAIVIMEPNKFGNGKLYATLDTIFVTSEYRRHGAGKMLLDFVISDLKNSNAIGLTSYIADNNEISQSFHGKNGFKELMKWREFYKDL